jgi:uncharacterized protein (TIGR02217 family)
MARINERISECVSREFTGGPRYRTLTVPLDNGLQVRNRRWLYPKHEYSAQFLNFRPDARDEVLRFIHAAAGSWLAFRFKDWMDFTATNQPLSPNIGTTDPVQLVKTYTAGGHSSQRIIQAIITATVFADGSPVAGSYDDELGLFTPNAAWASATYTWSGEFDVWVHFVEDYNPFSATDINHWSAHITLEEDRQS